MMINTISKKFTAIIAAGVMLMGLAACGNNAASAKPADLTGTWSETIDSKMKQVAVIKGNTITVNWHQDGKDMLYWKGSYVKPSKPGDFSWTSKGDTKAMSMALLASSDKTKKFEYKDGKIQYKASAMGSTVDVQLSRKK